MMGTFAKNLTMGQAEVIAAVQLEVRAALEKIDKGVSDSPLFTVSMPPEASIASKKSIATWLASMFPKCVKCYCRDEQEFVRMRKKYPIAANVYYVHLEGYDRWARTPGREI